MKLRAIVEAVYHALEYQRREALRYRKLRLQRQARTYVKPEATQ